MATVILEIEGTSLADVLAAIPAEQGGLKDAPAPMDAASLLALHGDTFSVDARAAGLLDYVPDLGALTDLVTRLNPQTITELLNALSDFRTAANLREEIVKAMHIATVLVKLTSTDLDDQAVLVIQKILDTPFVLDVFINLVQRLLGSPSASAASLITEEDAVMKASAISIPVMLGVAQLLAAIIRTLIHSKE